MGRPQPACVLDWTPVLFCSGRHFRRISEKPVGVGAVNAIDTLQQVQVFELTSIEDKVVSAFDIWYSIDWEASSLIDRQEEIEQAERNDASVDDWRCHNREDAGIQKI